MARLVFGSVRNRRSATGSTDTDTDQYGQQQGSGCNFSSPVRQVQVAHHCHQCHQCHHSQPGGSKSRHARLDDFWLAAGPAGPAGSAGPAGHPSRPRATSTPGRLATHHYPTTSFTTLHVVLPTLFCLCCFLVPFSTAADLRCCTGELELTSLSLVCPSPSPSRSRVDGGGH